MLYTHAAAALVALAVGLYTGWTTRGWKADSDLADAAEVQRLRERAAQRSVQALDRRDAQRSTAVAALDAADRLELERLRDAAAAYRPDPAPSCAPVEQRFAACRAALVEGAGLATEGDQLARGVERKHRGLAEYATGVAEVTDEDEAPPPR